MGVLLHTGFGARDGLTEAEEQCKVTMDALIVFKLARSLNAFPRRGDLDQNPLLFDANRLVEYNEFSSFLLGDLLVERET